MKRLAARLLLSAVLPLAALAAGCAGSSTEEAGSGASAALSQSETVTFTSDTRSPSSTYQGTSGEGGIHFKLVASHSTVSKTVNGTGLLAGVNQNTQDVPDTTVPGLNGVDGYSNLVIHEVSGSPDQATIEIDQVLKITQGDFVATVALTCSADAVFTTGTFADLAAGSQIGLRLTDAGEATLGQARRDAVQQSLANLSALLVKQLEAEGASSTPIVTDEYETTGHTELVGTSAQLTSSLNDNGTVHAKMHFGVTLDL